MLRHFSHLASPSACTIYFLSLSSVSFHQLLAGGWVQGVRERAQVFETLNFFKRPDVAVLCAFSGNTIACSCSMSATGAPSKALKVRPLAAKYYQLRHSCPLPNSLVAVFQTAFSWMDPALTTKQFCSLPAWR